MPKDGSLEIDDFVRAIHCGLKIILEKTAHLCVPVGVKGVSICPQMLAVGRERMGVACVYATEKRKIYFSLSH